MSALPCYVTTSWDDGHPCDLRIAGALERHDIPGTFYIPAASQRVCLDGRHMRELAQRFEVGAHTLRHLRLDRLPDFEAKREIAGSREYIEQTLGRSCFLFAPPAGRFRAAHLRMASEAGFRAVRTTELMSLALPRQRGGLAVMATTLQVFRHAGAAYWRNALRRLQPFNLWRYLRHGRGRDVAAAFESLLALAIARGGVVHLWGHGWEIEERGDWALLTDLLGRLAAHRNQLRLVTNGALCEEVFGNGSAAVCASSSLLP